MPKVRAKDATEKAAQTRVDVQVMEPGKYEVPDGATFDVKLHLAERDGRWIVMAGPGKGVQEETVVFRMWRYHEAVELRKKATTYDRLRRMHVVDHDALNRLKVQKYLLSWTLDRDNPRLALHRVNGVLTDESWDRFSKSLYPGIATTVIDEMNKVYELNG